MGYNLKKGNDTILRGKFDVEYASLKAPFDVQNLMFNASGFSFVSPAQLGAMRVGKGQNDYSMDWARTNMDALYLPEKKKIVLIKGGPLGSRYAKELVSSQSSGLSSCLSGHSSTSIKQFVIPKKDRGIVYALVEYCKKFGGALEIGLRNPNILKNVSAQSEFYDLMLQIQNDRTFKNEYTERISTADFHNNELTDFMFSDEQFGIKSKDYGDTLKELRVNYITFSFDSEKYAGKQKGMYLNKVCIHGAASYFNVTCRDEELYNSDNAFGVRFTPVGDTKSSN